MALFTGIAQKFGLLAQLPAQLKKTAESQATAKRLETQSAEQNKPKIGEGFNGNLFRDIAQKFNLIQPQPFITGELPAFQAAKKLGEEVKTKIGEPLAKGFETAQKSVAPILKKTRETVLPTESELRQQYITEGLPEEEIQKRLTSRLVEQATYGFSGGLEDVSKNLIKLLIKTKTAQEVKNLIPNIADDLANKIAKITDEGVIGNLLKKVGLKVGGVPEISKGTWISDKSAPGFGVRGEVIGEGIIGKNIPAYKIRTPSGKITAIMKEDARIMGEAPIQPTIPKELQPLAEEAEGIIPKVGKERGFAKTTRITPETPKVVKETLKEEPLTYIPTTMKADLEAGQKRVIESPQKAEEFLLDIDSMDMTKSGGEITATGVELMRHYAKSKNYSKEISVIENLAEKLTKAGQEINAAKLYTQMSPEGALLKAQRIVNKFNKSKFFYKNEIKLD